MGVASGPGILALKVGCAYSRVPPPKIVPLFECLQTISFQLPRKNLFSIYGNNLELRRLSDFNGYRGPKNSGGKVIRSAQRALRFGY